MVTEQDRAAQSLAQIILQLEQVARDLDERRLSRVEAAFVLGRLFERAKTGPLRDRGPDLEDYRWDPIGERAVHDPRGKLGELDPLDHHFHEALQAAKQACGWPSG